MTDTKHTLSTSSSAILTPGKDIFHNHKYTTKFDTYPLSQCGYAACERECEENRRYLGPSNTEIIYATPENNICIKYHIGGKNCPYGHYCPHGSKCPFQHYKRTPCVHGLKCRAQLACVFLHTTAERQYWWSTVKVQV